MGKRKRGRPHKSPEIPEEKIASLAAIGCTDEEIARVCGIGEATLKRNFEPLLKKGRAELASSVRRRQVQIMNSRSRSACTMAIWLGKVYCGQRDAVDVGLDVGQRMKERILEGHKRAERVRQEARS